MRLSKSALLIPLFMLTDLSEIITGIAGGSKDTDLQGSLFKIGRSGLLQ